MHKTGHLRHIGGEGIKNAHEKKYRIVETFSKDAEI